MSFQQSIVSRFFRRRRFVGPVALLAGALAVFPACEELPQEDELVEGQVFITAPGGNTQRLGSVEVLVFEEREIERFLDRKAAEIAERLEEAEKAAGEAREEAERLKADHRMAEQAYAAQERDLREETERILEELDAKIEDLEREVAANEQLIAQVDTRPEPPEGIPSRAEYQEFAERRSRWFSMDAQEREAWAEVLVGANREFRAEIEEKQMEREARREGWSDDLQVLRETIEQLGRQAEEAAERAERLETGIEDTPQIQDYLDGLPEPMSSAWTDADGEFEMLLPPGDRFAVFAEARRYLDGEIQRFKWFVWTETGARPSSRILLSNHNLIEAGSSENVVDISKLEGPRQVGL